MKELKLRLIIVSPNVVSKVLVNCYAVNGGKKRFIAQRLSFIVSIVNNDIAFRIFFNIACND